MIWAVGKGPSGTLVPWDVHGGKARVSAGTVVLIIKLLNWPAELHADESAQMMACAGKVRLEQDGILG